LVFLEALKAGASETALGLAESGIQKRDTLIIIIGHVPVRGGAGDKRLVDC